MVEICIFVLLIINQLWSRNAFAAFTIKSDAAGLYLPSKLFETDVFISSNFSMSKSKSNTLPQLVQKK